ncbi:hypothetical protein ACJX0J_019612, partial [Zea mays]
YNIFNGPSMAKFQNRIKGTDTAQNNKIVSTLQAMGQTRAQQHLNKYTLYNIIPNEPLEMVLVVFPHATQDKAETTLL